MNTLPADIARCNGHDMTQHYIKRGSRYVPVEDDLACLRGFDLHMLMIAASRYFIGRQTIATSGFSGELASAWPLIPKRIRDGIQRDLEGNFARDDEARAEGRDYKPLGADCDRQGWERVRAAWVEMDVEKEKTKCE